MESLIREKHEIKHNIYGRTRIKKPYSLGELNPE